MFRLPYRLCACKILSFLLFSGTLFTIAVAPMILCHSEEKHVFFSFLFSSALVYYTVYFAATASLTALIAIQNVHLTTFSTCHDIVVHFIALKHYG